MSELFNQYGDNCEMPPNASRAERAQCLRNRLRFNITRNTVFIALGSYLAITGVFCSRENPRSIPNKTVQQKVNDNTIAPEVLPETTPFDPLHPEHDEEHPIVVK
ncbi:MAG: hypothetical protein WCX61_01705 [Candidatus Peribacteraceae bacterium]|jgi:hypothetical protein